LLKVVRGSLPWRGGGDSYDARTTGGSRGPRGRRRRPLASGRGGASAGRPERGRSCWRGTRGVSPARPPFFQGTHRAETRGPATTPAGRPGPVTRPGKSWRRHRERIVTPPRLHPDS